MTSSRVLIYLLRRDLRVADNPILHEIARITQQSQHPFTHFLPVYVFAAQQIEVSGFLLSDLDRSPFPQARSPAGGFWRCGPHRAKFLAESVWDAKKGLEKAGNGLEIRVGMAGQVIKEILDAFQQANTEVAGVWMTDEEGVEEKREERDVRRAVEGAQTEFKLWVDEKFYVDEFANLIATTGLILLTTYQSRCTVSDTSTAPRRLYYVPQTSRAPPRSPSTHVGSTEQIATSSRHNPSTASAFQHPRHP